LITEYEKAFILNWCSLPQLYVCSSCTDIWWMCEVASSWLWSREHVAPDTILLWTCCWMLVCVLPWSVI